MVTSVSVDWLIDRHWEYEHDRGVRKSKRVKNQEMTFKVLQNLEKAEIVWFRKIMWGLHAFTP